MIDDAEIGKKDSSDFFDLFKVFDYSIDLVLIHCRELDRRDCVFRIFNVSSFESVPVHSLTATFVCSSCA